MCYTVHHTVAHSSILDTANYLVNGMINVQ